MKDGQAYKFKSIAIFAATALVLGWVLYNLVPMILPARDARELSTPGWKLVGDLNAKLLEEGFKDTAFVVESEEPLKLRLVGGVHSSEELADLREFLKELRPGSDDEVEVEIIR